MTMRYEVVRQDDPVLRERLKELAKVRRRFGYPLADRRLSAIAVRRRLHVFLRREGHEVNHKRLFRIYREEQLHVRRRGGRKRAMGTRAPMVLPLMPNQRPLSVIACNPLPGNGIAGLRVRPADALSVIARNHLPGNRWPPVPDHDCGR